MSQWQYIVCSGCVSPFSIFNTSHCPFCGMFIDPKHLEEIIKDLSRESLHDDSPLRLFMKQPSTKNTTLMILLAFIFPGMGHLYLGKVSKGLFIMVTTLLLLFFTIIGLALWLLSVLDAWSLAREYKKASRWALLGWVRHR